MSIEDEVTVQLRDGLTRSHVDFEFAAVQLVPKMLAQRLLSMLS
jgi:hypothetical protein